MACLPVFVSTWTFSLMLACWYSLLSPTWMIQYGRIRTAEYSQGFGLWLNYTQHSGDPWFNPGNSFSEPHQPSGYITYDQQCKSALSLPSNCSVVIGNLNEQYCHAIHILCSWWIQYLSIAMSLGSGLALVISTYTLLMILIPHKTLADKFLPWICCFQALLLVSCFGVWYFAVYMPLMKTYLYQNEYSRCSRNSKNRSCWSLGPSAYVVFALSVSYVVSAFIISILQRRKFQVRVSFLFILLYNLR